MGGPELVMGFYAVLGSAVAALQVYTVVQNPCFPPQLDNADWNASWLVTAIADWLVLGLCLSAVILVTEGLPRALLWILSFNSMGGLVACVYIVHRLFARSDGKGIRLMSEGHVDGAIAFGRSPLSAFYAVAGLAFLSFLSVTYSKYPLFPLQLKDVGWSRAWLFVTCADYFTTSLCMSCIILATEELLGGIAWSVLISIFGSPFACIYLVRRVYVSAEEGMLGIKLMGIVDVEVADARHIQMACSVG